MQWSTWRGSVPLFHASAALGLIALVGCNDGDGGIQSSNTNPVVEILSPQVDSGYDDGEEIIARGNITDREDSPDRLTVTLIVDNGEPIEVTNDGSGSWRYVLPELEVGSYVLEAQVRDTAGGAGSDTVSFTVDPVNQPPTALITSHEGGEEIPEDTPITFQGVVTDEDLTGLSVQWVSDKLSEPLGESTPDFSGKVQLTVPGLPPDVHQVRLIAYDGEYSAESSVGIVILEVNESPDDPDIDLIPSQPITGDTLTLKLNNEGADPDGDDIDYDISWTRDGDLVPELRGKRNVTPDFTARGQVWKVEVQAEDTSGALSGTQSAEVTILNSAPAMSGATITPASPKVTDTLTVIPAGASDPDGDTVTYHYSWLVNGSVILDHDANTLDSRAFQKGDEVRAQVTPEDGSESGETVVTPPVTIQDSIASGLEVSISPSAPILSDPLTCNITTGATDADNEMVSYLYTWLRDGDVVYEQEASRSSVEARLTGLGEAWTCVVTPVSGGAQGVTAQDVVNIRAGEGSVIVTELMPRPTAAPNAGEYVELHNIASVAVDVSGWVLRDASGDSFVISPSESLMVESGAYLVVGASEDTDENGGISVDVVWANFSLDDSADEVVIEADGEVVDRMIYGTAVGLPTPLGAALNLDISAYDSALNDAPEGWCRATSPTRDGDFGTPGRINDLCACAASDTDGDGYGASSDFCSVTDCDDSDDTISPSAEEICEDGIDNDCQGGDPVCDCEGSDDDGDGYGDALGCPIDERDCNDNNPDVNPGEVEICDDLIDNDCDGEDAVCPCDQTDDDGDGFGDGPGCPLAQLDCDDDDGTIYPGGPELCDDKDNDCDGSVDDGLDQDMDGFRACPVAEDEDCDDRDAEAYPGAEELCDAKDNDCDTRTDEGFDADSDGVTTCAGDCNDNNGDVSPQEPEVCGNGVDDNCSGEDADCGCASEVSDSDGDGYGTSDLCEVKDCNDADPGIFPGAAETCEKADDDCDGVIDEGLDVDGDGIRTCDGEPDCDDSDADIYPGAEEACALVVEVDDDCDGLVDEGFDRDDDGFTTCGPLSDQDCADFNPLINPAAEEICDLDDNDCDGEIDESSSADQYEPNETLATAHNGGFLVAGADLVLTIDEPGDTDWFIFTTSELGLASSGLRVEAADIGIKAEMCSQRVDICVDVDADPGEYDQEIFPSFPGIPQGGEWALRVEAKRANEHSCEPFLVRVFLK